MTFSGSLKTDFGLSVARPAVWQAAQLQSSEPGLSTGSRSHLLRQTPAPSFVIMPRALIATLLAVQGLLFYDTSMRLRSFLYQVRSAFALLLGISSENARNGDWWEIDLVLVVLAGAFVLGAIAWTQL